MDASGRVGPNVKRWHYKHKYQLQFSYLQPQIQNLIQTVSCLGAELFLVSLGVGAGRSGSERAGEIAQNEEIYNLKTT